ncbi:hypothetical protein SKTS_21830 [Sulfurimicrobium lacus]|uniref:Uncharacterized protein n=1 Tax=Sulfurimicrobium lacus TaxID=2715678 RepID=A0A6F8VDX4_9PROT|nr:hypothetical protein [Sulfurimicrobium lacus]BCB27297.1 hypothetical protein SKTS_21830 [Sulfurimicrobium lacus]
MKQAEDIHTIDFIDNQNKRLDAIKQTLNNIEKSVVNGLCTIETLTEEKTEIEEQGYCFGTIHYKAGKYAYLIHPQQNGERVREYIGADPERIEEAHARIARAQRHRQLIQEINQLENHLGWITRQIETAQDTACHFNHW